MIIDLTTRSYYLIGINEVFLFKADVCHIRSLRKPQLCNIYRNHVKNKVTQESWKQKDEQRQTSRQMKWK